MQASATLLTTSKTMKRKSLLPPWTIGVIAAIALSAATHAACGEEGASRPDEKPVVELVADPRTDDPTFFVGAPMPFAIRLLLAPEAKAATVATAWHQAARVEVSVAGGAPAEWRALPTLPMSATRADAANPVARLVPEKRGHSAYLVVPPDAMAALAPGDYRLRARVDVTVTPAAGADRALALEAGFPFRVAVAASPDEKMRVALLASQFTLETEGSLDVAIRELEEGLGASGRAEMRHHLGWLYVRKGDVGKAIECFRAYVTWARASGIPRVKCCGRDVQEIADELEAGLPILEKRLAEERPR